MPALAERVLWMRLLELYPDLGACLEQEGLLGARKLTVPALRIERGAWTPTEAELGEDLAGEPLCLLVARGLLFRVTALGERRSSVVAGEGDILPIPSSRSGNLVTLDGFVVAEPAIVAPLDGSFLAAASRWPALTAEILRRLSDQLRRAADELAISHLPRTEDRVLALAWQLAERFGRSGDREITLHVRLTHDTIGTLIGAERSTVTLAIRRLEREGALRRGRDGLIRLRSDSRARFDGEEGTRLDGEGGARLDGEGGARLLGGEAQDGVASKAPVTASLPGGRSSVPVATEQRPPTVVEAEDTRPVAPSRSAISPAKSETDVAAILARLRLAHEFASTAIRRSQRLCEHSERYRSDGAAVVTAAENLTARQ